MGNEEPIARTKFGCGKSSSSSRLCFFIQSKMRKGFLINGHSCHLSSLAKPSLGALFFFFFRQGEKST